MEASNDSNIIARNNNNNNIFVLSVEGQVHEISIHEASSPDDDDHNAQPSLKLEGSWNTGICGATCLKVLGSMNQLVIGYDSGYLEAWKIRKRNKSEPVLIWRGILDFHIRSVAPLRRRAAGDSNENNTGSEVAPPKKEKNTNKEQETNEYFLLVTLQSEAGNDRHATASLVEILDLATIQEAYLDSKRLTIPLYGHLRFPAPGMELVDSSTLPSDDTGRLPKRVQVLPSRGSDRAMVLGGEENSMCGVALSDGTVALVSPYLDSWGVAQDRHQLLLSYPAIGCGRVFVDEDHHFVCCLRGGTCFLIPTRADSQKHVTVISYPHDVDADTTSAYVQGFTAGTLLMDEKSSLPVLIYAWAGGAVDVYACHLVHPTQEETLDSQLTQMNWKEPDASEHKLLEEMMNNESLSIVLTLFDDMEKDQNHKLLQEENWEMAQKEFKLSEFTSPVTLKQLCSDKLESLRFLLLALASQ